MSDPKVVGTCSLCGGPVVVPSVYHSTSPPVPICQSCGATQKTPRYGPIVEMEKKKLLNEIDFDGETGKTHLNG